MKWQNRNPSFIMLILISNKPLYFLSFNSLSALHFKIYKCPMTIQSFYIVFKHLQRGGVAFMVTVNPEKRFSRNNHATLKFLRNALVLP